MQAVCGRAVLGACQHPGRERGGDGGCQWEPAGTKPCGKLKMQAELGVRGVSSPSAAWTGRRAGLGWFNNRDGWVSGEPGQGWVGRGAEPKGGSAEAFICNVV